MFSWVNKNEWMEFDMEVDTFQEKEKKENWEKILRKKSVNYYDLFL